MVTLAIISFKSVGTKICISSNKIYIQEPNIIQGIIRWSYGSNREEIHHLLKPLFRCINLYNPKDNENFKLLYSFAIKGLRLLKKSYDNISSNLCHTLDLYIGLLESTQDDKKFELDRFENFRAINDNLNISEISRINLNNLFKNIWSDEEIEIICGMLLLSEKNKKSIKNYISGIESILYTKEKTINKIICDTTNLF